MAFNSAAGRAEYTATAGQTLFPFTFKIYETSDIKVYQTAAGATPDDISDLLIETTDYTVVITGDSGGTVTLLTGATVNDAITIKRDLPIVRNIEYQESGDLPSSTLNMDQDYQTYLIADKESDNSRFLRLQDSAQGVSTDIPSPVPLNFFQWNATGTGIVNVATLQADGYIWTAGDVYTKTEADALLDLKADQATTYTITEIDTAVAERRKLYAIEPIVITPTANTDYTLTAAENLYGRLTLANGLWTTEHSIIVDTSKKAFVADNSGGTYNATIKTSAGTGVIVLAGETRNLYNDGTNVIIPETTNIDASFNFNGIAGTLRKSYNIASITRIGSGSYDVVFDVPMDTADYTIALGVSDNLNNNLKLYVLSTSVTVNGFSLACKDPGVSSFDALYVYAIITGGRL